MYKTSKIILIYCLFSFFCLLKASNINEAIKLYNDRAIGAKGLKADKSLINNAILTFSSLKDQKNITIQLYLLKCYYFKGQFASENKKEKKEAFEKGKNLGEKAIKQFSGSVSIRYWYLVNLGSWAEVYGKIMAAKEGVADLMRKHSKVIIDIDHRYSNGGGYFMLGVVHLKSPYIPFFLTWPSNQKAVDFLKLSYDTDEKTFAQRVYYSRSLYENGEKYLAKKILKNVIIDVPSDNYYLEDLFQQGEAKILLELWTK